MAYIIIEVERMINIRSRKIRFWLDKGLFPFIERDENGVRYFAKNGSITKILLKLFKQFFDLFRNLKIKG